jgi:hypothetical protein
VLISNVPSATGFPFLANTGWNGVALMTGPVSQLAKAYCKELSEISESANMVIYGSDEISRVWESVSTLAYSQPYRWKDVTV